MTVRIEKPSLNLREELAKGTDNTLDKAVWGDLTVNGTITATPYTPASASDTGTAGQVAWDDSYIYICTATDTWKRVAVATW